MKIVLPALLMTLIFSANSLSAAARYRDDVFTEIAVKTDEMYAVKINEKNEPQKLYLDIYSPGKDSEEKRRAIIFFHGGSFRTGKKENLSMLAEALAKRGFVVISAQYRLREKPSVDLRGTVADAVSDGLDASRYVRTNAERFGICPDKIFIGGDSAGAYIALQHAYLDGSPAESRVKAAGVIDIYGGNPWAEINKGEPPVLIIHGDADEMVEYYSSLSFMRKCKEADVYCELFTMEGEGHSYKNRYFTDIVSAICSFTSKVLQ